MNDAALARRSAGWAISPDVRAYLGLVALVIAGMLLVGSLAGDPYVQTVVALTAVTVVGTLGLNYAQGNAGTFTMAHGAFMAIGAYTVAILGKGHVDGLIAIGAGILVSVAAAAVFGSFTLRFGQVYFAIATLALVTIVTQLPKVFPELTGGYEGIVVPGLSVLGVQLASTRTVAVVCVGTAGALAIAQTAVLRSKLGREFRAVRDDPLAASTSGVRLTPTRSLAFLLQAAYSAVAGSFYGYAYNFISPPSFGPEVSVFGIAMLVLGGAGTVLGAVLGSVLLTGATELLRVSPQFSQLFFGLVILVVAIGLQGGIVGTLTRLGRGLRSRRRPPTEPEPGPETSYLGLLSGSGQGREAVAGTATGSAALRVEHVTKRFGGVLALDDVSIEVAPGSIVGLIGPNGSGKSTLINVISGVIPLDRGAVWVGGRDCSRRSPQRVVSAGVARTFQTGRLFADVPVSENVHVASDHRRTTPGPLGLAAPSLRGAVWAAWMLGLAGLTSVAEELPGTLSFGQVRLVELARALAVDPAFVLLDEPAAGLSEMEQATLARLLRSLRDIGLGMLLVEHHMPMVMELADSVTVLDLGRVIGSGTAERIQGDPAILKAYLGGQLDA